MREQQDGVAEFGGIAKDVAPSALPPGLFQTDQGGDRYFRGAWARRKGMLHSELAKFDGAVVALLGFELPGGDYALLTVEGTNVHGDTNVDVQDYDTDDDTGGFGETSFGEGGFGE